MHSPAIAQTTPPNQGQASRDADTAAPTTTSDRDIIVTGSSLKGVAPVGSALTTLGKAQIDNTAAQSVQQILKSVPSITGLQAPSQGSSGSADNSGTNAPTIHGLGASASNSTLILMNGHRLPTTGANHMLADPNIIPTIALERVEVLTDGASSVYGSDAVAGVINFITRKNFSGLEANVQHGFGNAYHTNSAAVLWGKSWSTGSVLAAYSFSDKSNLSQQARSYARSVNLVPLGGTNQTTNKCANPSLTAGGKTYYNTGTAGSYNTTQQGNCSPAAGDLLPQETRHTAYVQLRQDVGDNLHIVGDIDYSFRKTVSNVSRGSASATMTSANPYFRAFNLGGTTPTSYTINFDANQLYGPGATSTGSAEDVYAHLDATYDFNPKWSLNVGGVFGRDHSQIISQGTLNQASFNLAVAGTTSATLNGIPETVTQTLTTANAFDPFGGQTSTATLASLTDSATFYNTTQTMRNAYAKISGELFDLPGGAVKAAVGGELLGYSIDQAHTALNGLGGASANSIYIPLTYKRNVQSVYGELYLPLVKDGFVRSIDVNVSGRFDHYSDFGSTTNPKVAANFEPVRGIKFRGNWSRSFVAPALTSIGANASGQTGESAFAYGLGTTVAGGLTNVPISLYPSVTAIPGAVCTSTSCNLSNVYGVFLQGGNARLKPQTGTDWSVGFDLTPVQIPGLRVSLTYWSDQLRNGITAPTSAYAFGAASLSNLLTLYPGGATAAQIAAVQGSLPQTGASATAYWIYNYTQNNVLNLNVAGIDFEAMYHFNTPAGNVTLDGSFTRKTKFEQWFGADGTHFSVLGTAGFNTTFPSLKTEGRANIGYDKGPFNAVVGVTYEGPYTWWGAGVMNPIVRNAAGVPVGGGDHVSPFTTVDLHVSYTLKDFGRFKKANLFVDATNLFDKDPPFVNVASTSGATGYDASSANPLGRVVTIGLRSSF
ncbi:MAG: TonB-dependent receptor [Sphingomonadales bacterium]|nr:TonB-dependent receptor [Sphingomonadales bacterium]